MSLWTSHYSTFVYEGVIVHVRGRERFPGKICEPVTEIIMTHLDKSYIFTVKGMKYQEFSIAAVTVPG